MLKRTVFLFVIAALALPASGAASTTVAHDGTTTRIAGDAESDDVRIAFTSIDGPGPVNGDAIRVSNPAGVTPGPGCAPEAGGTVLCPLGDEIAAALGDGDDRFGLDEDSFYDGFYDVGTTVEGQGGADTLAGSYRGTLDGGGGDDTLRPTGSDLERVTGGAGSDTVELVGYADAVTVGGGESDYGARVEPDVERLRGGSGDQLFRMGPNAGSGYAIEGGGGEDVVSYADAAGPVKAVLGGTGTDTIAADVEGLTGSEAADELVGDAGANALSGRRGDDRLIAGDGTDTLWGGDGNDTLDAGGGADELSGSDGNDRLDGGAGDDGLFGDAGSDVLRGGADRDRVTYTYSFAYEEYTSTTGSGETVPGVTITADDVANDGFAQEGDDVGADIEVLHGTSGDDVIAGSAADNSVVGKAGNDRIDGGGGADKLHGDSGGDVVAGGAGNDELHGGGDDDQLDGGPGEDLAIGQDSASSVDGIDLVELRDGERDTAACQVGLARVLADQHDVVDPKCSLVERFTFGAPGVPPPSPGPSPLLRVHHKGTVVDRRGVARIRVTCAPAPLPCAGRLSLFTLHRRKLTRLGRTVFAVPAGKTRAIRVKLGKVGRRLVRTRRSVRTQVFVAHQDPAAKPLRIATIGLRRARR